MKTTLKISGMHCGACATSIQMVLSNQGGVSKADVDYKTKKAIIEFDPKKTNISKLIKSVNEIGYKASK